MCTPRAVVAVGQAIYPDGVVEIAGGFAVDGDDGERAEIAAAGEFRLADGLRHAFGLLHHFGRKAVREVVFADDDFDVDAEIVGVAQDLDHAAHRTGALFRVLQQLHVHDHAVQLFDGSGLERTDADAVDGGAGGRELQAFGDLDPLPDAVVLRHHVGSMAADAELADHGGVGAFEHLDDLAIGAPAGLDARDAHHHAVAVHGLGGGVGRDEDVAGDARERGCRRPGSRSRRGAC